MPSKLIKNFLQLLKIDSPSLKEGRLAFEVKRKLKVLGLRVTEDRLSRRKIGGETGNLIVNVTGNLPRAPKILFNAHLDTVAIVSGVKPKIRGEVIRSNGKTGLGADCKAGVAAILEMLRILKDEKIPHGDLQVIFTVGEEVGLRGAKAIDRKLFRADFGFAVDGGAVRIVHHRAPSQVTLRAEVIGRAAHAGVHPERGINAIAVASHAISRMKLGRIDSETTANIGVIEGGTATNIIPEKVELKGEVRSHDLKKLKARVRNMKQCLIQACRKHNAKLRFNAVPEYPAFKIPENHPAVRIAWGAVKQVGPRPVLRATGGGSDANWFNAYGIPTVIVGVGGHNPHTPREYIRTRDLITGTRMLVEIVRAVAGA